MNLRSLFLLSIGVLFFYSMSAQVEGLSYEIGGIAEYSCFDDEVGVEDGILLGGEFGFGLGRLLELRGSYQQGINLQRDFGGLDGSFDGLSELDVDYRQYGGDIQFNLLKSAIKPYITLGAGVVEIEGDGLDESSSLFVRGGLGVLLTANDRFAWNLFGTVNTFSANPYSSLLSDAERASFGVDLADRDFEDVLNFTAGTKLTFYLGGRDPDDLTDLDRALQRSMQAGLRGVAFEFEPTYSWLDFGDDLPYADGQAIGAKLGVDFGPYFGVRAFYHRGMQDGDFLEFDELNMYGGEMVFNLNEPSGIVPFVVLGGGYLDIGNDYVGRDVDAVLEDKPFAMGGLGLRVPLADELLLKGSARSIIMTNDEIGDVVNTQDVSTSWMYQVGMEFRLGKKEKKPLVVEMSEYEKALYELQQQAEAEKNALEVDSESEIRRLKKEVEELRKMEAEAQVNEEVRVEKEIIIEEKQMVQSADQITIPKLEGGEIYIRFGESENTLTQSNTEKVAPTSTVIEKIVRDTIIMQPEGIVLQPEELQEMLKSVSQSGKTTADTSVTGGDEPADKGISLQDANNELRVQNRILELEIEQLKEKDKMRDKNYQDQLQTELRMAEQEFENKRLEKELKESKQDLRDQNKVNEVANSATQKAEGGVDVSTDDSMMNDSTGNFLNYKHASAMMTIGLGEANGVGLGFRFHYGIPKTDIDVVPQVYYGVIGQRQYGFDFNAQKPILKNKYPGFQPYVGLGVGLAGLEADNDVVDNTGSFNIILGTFYDSEYGRFYFDYTNRNFFNMNQLSAGYIFKF